MKKIITFLFCIAVISSAFAQNNNHEKSSNNAYYASVNERPFDQNNFRNDRSYSNTARFERDKELDKVNSQNNFEVQQVLNDFNLNIWEKKDILDALESQRIQKVNFIYSRYSNSIAYFNARNNNQSY